MSGSRLVDVASRANEGKIVEVNCSTKHPANH